MLSTVSNLYYIQLVKPNAMAPNIAVTPSGSPREILTAEFALLRWRPATVKLTHLALCQDPHISNTQQSRSVPPQKDLND